MDELDWVAINESDKLVHKIATERNRKLSLCKEALPNINGLGRESVTVDDVLEHTEVGISMWDRLDVLREQKAIFETNIPRYSEILDSERYERTVVRIQSEIKAITEWFERGIASLDEYDSLVEAIPDMYQAERLRRQAVLQRELK